MTVTGKVASDGGSETLSPEPDHPEHPETCPNDKFRYSLADDAVCGSNPRFFGRVGITFNSPTIDPRQLTIDMPGYTLSVSSYLASAMQKRLTAQCNVTVESKIFEPNGPWWNIWGVTWGIFVNKNEGMKIVCFNETKPA